MTAYDLVWLLILATLIGLAAHGIWSIREIDKLRTKLRVEAEATERAIEQRNDAVEDLVRFRLRAAVRGESTTRVSPDGFARLYRELMGEGA